MSCPASREGAVGKGGEASRRGGCEEPVWWLPLVLRLSMLLSAAPCEEEAGWRELARCKETERGMRTDASLVRHRGNKWRGGSSGRATHGSRARRRSIESRQDGQGLWPLLPQEGVELPLTHSSHQYLKDCYLLVLSSP